MDKKELKKKLHHHVHNSNWFFLLPTLLLLILFYPYIEPKEASWYFNLTYNLILLTIVYTAGKRPSRIVVGVILAAPALLLQWFPEPSHLRIMILISISLFFLYTMMLTIAFLRRAQEMSMNEVCAAISVYLLLGLTWTTFYLILEYFVPNSFSMRNNVQEELSWANLLYFSFITLTTVGYGDIVPISEWARSLTIIEAVVGILFIPVMISSSLSLYLVHRLKRPS